jgi:hypothetical protein
MVFTTEVEFEDRDLHHQGATTAHGREEAGDPNLQDTQTTMMMMK